MVNNEIDRNIARTKALYFNSNPFIPTILDESLTLKKAFKRKSLSLPSTKIDINETGIFKSLPTAKSDKSKDQLLLTNESNESSNPSNYMDITLYENQQTRQENTNSNPFKSTALTTRRQFDKVVTPQWHAPWELSAVISGHIGWVRSISFDPSNEWFATGSADRTIKIWDLAKCCAGSEGGLKLTLTGHVSAIRGLVVSPRHPYLFSAGEDKMVKCWDLEYNKVIRHYHGHLSGVFCIALHPTLDLLVTGGRDSVARVWDIRTKHQIHVLGGHSNTVGGIITNSVDPQIITSSYDSTIKLWDLAAGKSMTTLTQHKKAVRHICPNIKEFSFVSCGADNVKKWQSRDGRFLMNFSGHNSIINCTAVNEDGVMVTCGDNGSMMFWDYNSGYSFQQTNTIAQPGSLDAEAGIYSTCYFDLSGSRLITCEADKSIKIWKENSEATEETHPIDMDGWTKKSLKLKRY